MIRPIALTDTFKAWKLQNGVHYPLRVEGSTLPNVVAEAQGYCVHKDQFAILQTGDGKQTLRVYRIKKGREIWVRSASTGNAIKSRRLEAELVTEMLVEAYAPVEPWQWTPGADVVGADRGVICG